jgi:hypothetical protein
MKRFWHYSPGGYSPIKLSEQDKASIRNALAGLICYGGIIGFIFAAMVTIMTGSWLLIWLGYFLFQSLPPQYL